MHESVQCMTDIALDSAAILANARALLPEIRASADGIESERRMPEELLAKLRRAGVYRIAMPGSWGGPEMDPLTQIELIEALSRADASTGWVAMITSDSGFYSAWLEEDIAREMYPSLDLQTAGLVMPAGRAEVIPGGYRVNGQRAFGSGSLHAAWIIGGCIVCEDGVPRVGSNGLPEARICFFPPRDVEILDTWKTTGLAGSGSNDYRVADLFVPAERTFWFREPSKRKEPLYQYPGMFFCNFPGVPLGAARAALDELSRLANERVTLPSGTPWRDEYRIQEAVAQGEGVLLAARGLVFDVMGELWRGLCSGSPPDLALRARIGLMSVHVMRAAREVVQLAYDTAATSAIYRKSPLDRVLRDTQTMAAHIIGQRRTYAMVGQALLGHEPATAFF